MKVLFWRRPDGGSSFTICSTESEEAARAHAVQLTTAPEHEPLHRGFVLIGVCDDTEMPDGGIVKTNPTAALYKAAWEFDGKPVINMDKAREVHRNRLREARAPKLAVLDVEYQRADEDGDSAAKADVVLRKRELRDVTALAEIDAAKDVRELAAVWPAGLSSVSGNARNSPQYGL